MYNKINIAADFDNIGQGTVQDMANDHRDHRKRLKEEFRKYGLDHFASHRILELLLFYVIPRKDTNPLAHRLIERFGSISGVAKASHSMLMEVEGVGEETATYLKLLSAFMECCLVDANSNNGVIRTTEDAKNYVRYHFFCETDEHVLLICLDKGGKILFSGVIAQGAPERVELVPSDIVRRSLRANASEIVLAHNHPGGLCNPSSRDRSSTIRIQDALEQVDVQLFDHLIVGVDDVCSLREIGMI